METNYSDNYSDKADSGVYAHHSRGTKPLYCGDFRCQPADFIVEERLGFELSGQGEHMCLWVEKQGQNTIYVAKQLAQFAKVRVREVSYCGLKDRHGITRQWFCLPVPIKAEFDQQAFECEGVKILKAVRHTKKLRTGVHQANRFSIVIRHIKGPEPVQSSLNLLLEKIQTQGVPNYYGPQRFGHGGNNLGLADRMFAGEVIRDRKLKSIVLSAARSYLFNQLLSARVSQLGLGKSIDGDIFRLDGSNSFFASDADSQILKRLNEKDLHVALPLPGSEKILSEKDALAFESKTLAPLAHYIDGLKPFNLSADSKDMVLLPEQMSYEWLDDDLKLEFTLPKGAFATSVMRELMQLKDCSLQESSLLQGLKQARDNQ